MDDFGHNLLKVIEEQGTVNGVVLVGQLATMVRTALGVSSPEIIVQPPPPPPRVRPEYPNVRTKIDGRGNVLARKLVESHRHFEQLLKEDPLIVHWFVEPPDTAEPEVSERSA